MVTRFDGYSHEQLWHMIAALDPGTVAARAAQLTTAATTIEEIGEALKRHEVRGWRGEAAQAFHDWAGRAGNATLRLSEYSAASAQWMSRAGQVMHETRGEGGVPPYDPPTAAALTANIAAARAAHNDPDAQRIAHDSRAKLTTDHERAIDGLRKLAEAYEQSTTQLNRAEIPTFPPVPTVFVPQNYGNSEDISPPGERSGGGRPSSHSSSVPIGAPGGTPSNEPSSAAGRHIQVGSMLRPTAVHGLVTGQEAADCDPGVVLDSLGTISEMSASSGYQAGAPVNTGGGIIPGAAIPPLPLPPFGGLVTPGGASGSAGAFPGTNAPGGNLGTISPRDTGIVGGRPVGTAGPAAGIPRGTVIGSESTPAGGRGLGGMAGGGTHGGPRASAPGRRLAMEPGGVVGGRQPGADGRPFTQGGSGLVRGNTGAMAHGGAGANSPGKRQGIEGGQRPEYLAEDVETWEAHRHVVPPVID
ncbi:hypothetical protein [Streptomyces sp. NPDC060031]|uniref:hypothetical protein n=1 Tax=Streptomyces sp. NPDC060031 TaxID=3347043 RepID=UPI0036746779